MSPADSAASLLEQNREHFVGRLLTLAPYAGVADASELAQKGPGPLLRAVAQGIQADGSREIIWLMLAVMNGTFPTGAQVLAASRAFAVADPGLVHRIALEAIMRSREGFARIGVPLEIVENAVIVDVDFCATHMHNTGIQRVVRQTMNRWERDHDLHLVGWTHHGHTMRTLTEAEHERVVNWTGVDRREAEVGIPEYRLVVPFRSQVLVPEVPQHPFCAPLSALAQYSNNDVEMIGYDAIPVLSADTVPPEETERFGAYLAIVKHAHRVAGISAGATLEFQGFAGALGAQGSAGPTTFTVQLPVDAPDRGSEAVVSVESPSRPSVLCVGSQEPRKNQLAVLFAAETLWREGHDFSLTFVGGGSQWFTRIFDARVKKLRKAGHNVTVRRGISDSEMLAEYRRARFTVFPSLHEGYGLPVAESIVLGVPVVTSNYGSTAEIAQDGGCLTVDPRDDESLIDAMRSLLVDDVVRDRLRVEIDARPQRTWDDYAAELWQALVVDSRSRG